MTTNNLSLLRSLEWRLIGPHRGGRVVAAAGDPDDPALFYFGACAGGVWKTNDAGTYWENISDGYFNTAAVGAIAVSSADPNVIYVGMGESCIRGDIAHGDGVYKSTDRGKTWVNVGLRDTRHIARVRIHPHKPDLVYVAAFGHAWGPNSERGVFRSKDAGKTWEQVLFRSQNAGAIDLCMDPSNPRVLYAAIWEGQRYPHKLVSGGTESSLYKSTDGGDTWVELTSNPGLPKGVKGRIGVAVAPNSERVWALVEAHDGGLFRSDDSGATWQRLNASAELRRRPFYFQHIVAHPQDPDTVWVLSTFCWKSIDGGHNFVEIPVRHADIHDLWVDPKNPRRMILGTDGGASVSLNGGDTWSTFENQPTAQFYHVTTDNRVPYRVYGCQQDIGAVCVPSVSTQRAITHNEWWMTGGGESGYIAVKPDDPNIVVGGQNGHGPENGRLALYNHRTGQEQAITIWPEATGNGAGAKDLKYRFQWTFPIMFSQHEVDVLYVAANHVFRSKDLGHSWDVISPDLTRNDPSKLGVSGGPITPDNSGVEIYCTIFALAECSCARGVLWAGTDDGLIHLSRDGGETWKEVTPKSLPEWALISVIEPSRFEAGTAYVAATRYKHDDLRPYLLKTTDFGKSWQAITNGIPHDDFTRVIREDPVRQGLLYAGTETGVYFSLDDGKSWQSLQQNLPIAPMHDLVVKDSDLVVATHGRSFWILDDVSPLRELDSSVLERPAYLFRPRTTIRFRVSKGIVVHEPGSGKNHNYAGPVGVTYRQKRAATGEVRDFHLDAGDNPPPGAIIAYHLQAPVPSNIRLTIRNEKGEIVNAFWSRPSEDGTALVAPSSGAEGFGVEPATSRQYLSAEPGLNRFVWNLSYRDTARVPGDRITEALRSDTMVPPGTYEIELSVGDQTHRQSLEILKDPRVPATQADLVAQFDLLRQIGDRLSQMRTAAGSIRGLRNQLTPWAGRAGHEGDAAAITRAANAIVEQLNGVEVELVPGNSGAARKSSAPLPLNSQLMSLANLVNLGDAAPTQAQVKVLEALTRRLNDQLDQLKATFDAVLEFNALVLERGYDPIHVT